MCECECVCVHAYIYIIYIKVVNHASMRDQCILYKVVDHACVQVAVTDSYLMEGMKVLYRVVLAIIILFTKHAGNGMRGTGNAGHSIAEFCRHLPVPPAKLLKVWQSAYTFECC